VDTASPGNIKAPDPFFAFIAEEFPQNPGLFLGNKKE